MANPNHLNEWEKKENSIRQHWRPVHLKVIDLLCTCVMAAIQQNEYVCIVQVKRGNSCFNEREGSHTIQVGEKCHLSAISGKGFGISRGGMLINQHNVNCFVLAFCKQLCNILMLLISARLINSTLNHQSKDSPLLRHKIIIYFYKQVPRQNGVVDKQ